MTATGPIVNRGQRLCMLTGDRLLAVDPPKARGADTKVQRDRMGRLEGSSDSRPLAARSIHGVHARASSRDLNRVSSSTVRLVEGRRWESRASHFDLDCVFGAPLVQRRKHVALANLKRGACSILGIRYL